MGAALMIRGVRRTELIGSFRCLYERSKKVREVLRGTVCRQVHVLQPWLVLWPPAVSCSSCIAALARVVTTRGQLQFCRSLLDPLPPYSITLLIKLHSLSWWRNSSPFMESQGPLYCQPYDTGPYGVLDECSPHSLWYSFNIILPSAAVMCGPKMVLSWVPLACRLYHIQLACFFNWQHLLSCPVFFYVINVLWRGCKCVRGFDGETK